MKRVFLFALLCTGSLHAQLGRTTDWFAFGGNAQRDGWEKNEQKFVKEDVKDFRMLWQHKLEGSKKGVGELQPPVVLGNLIGYRGFKELAIVTGGDNSIWSVDADLDRLYWQRKIATERVKSGCNARLTSAPALPGPVSFKAPAPKPAPAVGATAAPTTAPAAPKPERLPPFVARFVLPNPVYLLTADGMLRWLQQSDASDQKPAKQFVPSGLSALPLNIVEDTLYTATRSGCGEQGAVWSLDMGEEALSTPKSFKLGADVAGMTGVALGTDGTAFVQTLAGPFDAAAGQYGGAVVSLTKELTLRDYFVLPPAEGKTSAPGMNVTSPLVVTFKGQELVITANKDGRLYVLKASSMGGDDHHHFLSNSVVIPTLDGKPENGIWGGLSSWEDSDGARFVLAPVWGPLSTDLQSALPGTQAPNGSIVAFKLEDKAGVATLTPAWVSPDLDSPVPPVIAKGVVFALSSGKFSRGMKKPAKGAHATLYGLDGLTGKEIYSTKEEVAAAGNLTGMTIANGRVYFLTVDNTLQAFGKYLEH